MITLTRYYKDPERARKNFIDSRKRYYSILYIAKTEEEIANEFEAYTKCNYDTDEIWGIKSIEGNHSTVFFHDEYGGHSDFVESVEEINAMIDEENQRLNEIFDWFAKNGFDESKREMFIEEFENNI